MTGERGNLSNYRRGSNRACPCCAHRGWLIGRLLAECARCGFALDLEATRWGSGLRR